MSSRFSVSNFVLTIVVGSSLNFSNVNAVANPNASRSSALPSAMTESPLATIQKDLACSMKSYGNSIFVIATNPGRILKCSSVSRTDCKQIAKIEIQASPDQTESLNLNLKCISCGTDAMLDGKTLGTLTISRNNVVDPITGAVFQGTFQPTGESKKTSEIELSEKTKQTYLVNCSFGNKPSVPRETAPNKSATTTESFSYGGFNQNSILPTVNNGSEETEENPEEPNKDQTQAEPPKPAKPAKAESVKPADANNLVACPASSKLSVRNSSLQQILFGANKGDQLKILNKNNKKQKNINGEKHSFVQVEFKKKQARGWVAEKFIKTKSDCDGQAETGETETQPEKKQEQPKKPTPAPKKQEEEPASEVETGVGDILSQNCARVKVLESAKKSVARNWGNRPNSGGQCALGVRQSLQLSKVGGVNQGLGHAADYINSIKKYGYVDTGIRDLNQAPAGAVIVFSGPRTNEYFRTRRMSRPYGEWVGHVAIKGDDGFYYTDGRTRDAAIGWRGSKNVGKVRNVIGVFVPGNALIVEYRGKCGSSVKK